MGETKYDLFQDRTPRPAVNFNKMVDGSTTVPYVKKEKGDWGIHYAECALERLVSAPKHSWQDDLVKTLLDLYVQRTTVEEFMERKAMCKKVDG
jgi:hypothetical protein